MDTHRTNTNEGRDRIGKQSPWCAAVWGAVILGLAGREYGARANSYDITKTVVLAQNPGGPVKETHLVHAFADDAHSAESHDDGIGGGGVGAGGGAPQGPLTVELRYGGNEWLDTPVTRPHRSSNTRVTASPNSSLSDLALATGVHPIAYASVEADLANNPAAMTDTLTLNLAGGALILPPPDSEFMFDETAFAEAASAIGIEIRGKVLKAHIQDGTGPAIDVKIRNTGGVNSIGVGHGVGSVTGLKDSGRAGARDPLLIAFFDEASGDLVAESGVLYGCDMEAQGDARVEFVDGVGLKLKIGPNSEGYVSYYSASSWVQNPFEGSASVKDGRFAADGDLAGLPWEVTSDEGGVTAFLPSSVFSGWFDLHVIPTGLGDPTGDLGGNSLRGPGGGRRGRRWARRRGGRRSGRDGHLAGRVVSVGSREPRAV